MRNLGYPFSFRSDQVENKRLIQQTVREGVDYWGKGADMKKLIFLMIPMGLLVLVHCSSDSISPTSATVSAAGRTGSVSVKVKSGQAWTASTHPGSWDWIGISSGDKGTGNGTVNYFVLANKTGSLRTGSLTIAGLPFTITQQAERSGCTYSISATSNTFGPAPGSGTVNVTTDSDCYWTASTTPGSWDWIGISSGDKGAGNGTVNYSVLANKTGRARTGTLTISGKTFTVTQAGQ